MHWLTDDPTTKPDVQVRLWKLFHISIIDEFLCIHIQVNKVDIKYSECRRGYKIVDEEVEMNQTYLCSDFYHTEVNLWTSIPNSRKKHADRFRHGIGHLFETWLNCKPWKHFDYWYIFCEIIRGSFFSNCAFPAQCVAKSD